MYDCTTTVPTYRHATIRKPPKALFWSLADFSPVLCVRHSRWRRPDTLLMVLSNTTLFIATIPADH